MGTMIQGKTEKSGGGEYNAEEDIRKGGKKKVCFLGKKKIIIVLLGRCSLRYLGNCFFIENEIRCFC